MRILQVIHDFLPHHAAGSELYCFYLAQALARRHSVYLMFTEVDHAKEQYHYRRSSYFGIPYYEVIHNHVYRSFEDTYADRRMERIFSKVLDEVRPDVVHLQHLLNHSIGYISIAKKRGIPVVFTLHDYWLSCHNGGQRIRPNLEVCDELNLEHCGECARKFGSRPYWATSAASRLQRLRGRLARESLLDRLSAARVEAPRTEFVRPDAFSLEGEHRKTLIAHPPARIRFSLKPPPETLLRFGVGMPAGTFDKPGGGVTFEIQADGTPLWSRTLHPKQRPGDRRWVDDEVKLPAPRNSSLQLDLITRPDPGVDNQHCTAGWSDLRLERSSGSLGSGLGPARALYRALDRFLGGDSEAARVARVRRRQAAVLDACRRVDLFISPSPFLAEKMADFGLPEDRLLVSDNGIRVDALQPFRRRPSSEGLRFGYVGTIAPHKGLHVLLEAFERLLSRAGGRQAVLKIFGNRAWFADYVQRLESMASNGHVRFEGAFDNQDAHEVYAGIDVLVVPSIWWENSPITIHEAILTGTPVITSDFGGMADFVRDGKNGLLFRVGDPADLARKMESVLEDPDRLDRLRQDVIPIKEIDRDARDMELRYLKLLKAPAVGGTDVR